MKADDKVQYDECDDEERFTYFEEIAARLETLIDVVDKHATILRDNNLKLITEENAPEFDEDEAYKLLEEY